MLRGIGPHVPASSRDEGAFLGENLMRLIAIAVAGLFATANIVSAAPLNTISPELNFTPVELIQAQQKDQKAAPPKAAAQPKKDETMTQKVKRTWRNWTTPSHTFCVRTPIPVPLTSKTCTAKGKTVEEARSVCVQQNPLSYVSQGKC
jgi:hypothetical protein